MADTLKAEYKCGQCGKTFKSEEELYQHVRLVAAVARAVKAKALVEAGPRASAGL